MIENCCDALNLCVMALAGAIAALCWCLKLEYNLRKRRTKWQS